MKTSVALPAGPIAQLTAHTSAPRSVGSRRKALVIVGLLLGLLIAVHDGPARAEAPAKAARKSVYILAVDLKAHTITVQPIKFLTGASAVKAYRADHPGSTDGPPNDHYTLIPKKERAVLPLAKGAIVKLVTVDGTAHTDPVAVPQTKLLGYRGITKDLDAAAPFWITTEGGAVVQVEEQFVP